MSSVTLPPPVEAAVLQGLLRFCPAKAVAAVNASLPEAIALFEADRHFELERKLTFLYDELAKIEAEISSENAPPMRISYEEGSRKGSEKAIPSVQGIRVVAEFLKASRMSREGMTKAAESRATLDDVNDNSTWSKVRVDSKGHGTYYRGEPGGGSHSFKVVGVVKAGMVALTSVLMELDMYNEWFPFCNHAEELGSVSRFHKLSRFAIKVPWPLADREVAIGGYGADFLESNIIVIRAVSLSETEPMPNGAPAPSILKNNVRADLKVGGFVLEAISKSETKLSFIMNVDPKIPNIPIAVLNWVSGKMIWVLLYSISKAAGRAVDPNSKYAARRKVRPDVYEYFEKRAAEALAHLPD